MNHDELIRIAEDYLSKLDIFLQRMHHFHSELHTHLENYKQNPNPETEVDLQSSVAFFDAYIRTLIEERRPRDRVFLHDFDLLAFRLDDSWRAFEFKQFFGSIDYLNKIFVLKWKLTSEAPDIRIRDRMNRSYVYRSARLYYYLAPYEELQIEQIRLSSPGAIDFRGIPEAIKELREFVEDILTFQWVRKFIDFYDYLKYERPVKNAEKKLKLKEVLRREISAERQLVLEQAEDYEGFLKKMNGIADLVQELEKKGFARGEIVERSVIRSISMLHRLGFDEEKIKLIERSE